MHGSYPMIAVLTTWSAVNYRFRLSWNVFQRSERYRKLKVARAGGKVVS